MIVNFIDRLQKLPMVERASLQTMSMTSGAVVRKGGGPKQFEIRCVVVTTPAATAPANLAPQPNAPMSQPVHTTVSGILYL